MDDLTFNAMRAGLLASMRKFPNCRIANCECDSKAEKWNAGCHCLCHMNSMDLEFGKGNWNMTDLGASSEVGKPIKAVTK